MCVSVCAWCGAMALCTHSSRWFIANSLHRHRPNGSHTAGSMRSFFAWSVMHLLLKLHGILDKISYFDGSVVFNNGCVVWPLATRISISDPPTVQCFDQKYIHHHTYSWTLSRIQRLTRPNEIEFILFHWWVSICWPARSSGALGGLPKIRNRWTEFSGVRSGARRMATSNDATLSSNTVLLQFWCPRAKPKQ